MFCKICGKQFLLRGRKWITLMCTGCGAEYEKGKNEPFNINQHNEQYKNKKAVHNVKV